MSLKLQQGQLWKTPDGFIRIVHLERLEVGFKAFKNLEADKGELHQTSKKEFCRRIKGATLVPPTSGQSP